MASRSFLLTGLGRKPSKPASLLFEHFWVRSEDRATAGIWGIDLVGSYCFGSIINNTISNVTHVDDTNIACGIVSTGIGTRIENNTIYNIVNHLYTKSFGIAAVQDHNGGSMINNIIHTAGYGYYPSLYNLWSRPTIEDYNCYYNCTNAYGGTATAGDNDLIVNPQFADPDNLDFTPLNWQLMESGKPSPTGNPTHIGAVGKPSAYDIIYRALGV